MKTFRRFISTLSVLAIVFGFFAMSVASAGAAGTSIAQRPRFEPSPKTPYAAYFAAKCEDEQWFLDEVERLLNAHQKTIDNITSAKDLNIIRALGVRNKDVTGKIPSAIGELKQLRYLFLSGNKLSGSLPTVLFNLPNLTNIDLSNNNYSGSIPTGFGNLPKLQTLNLSGNSFSGAIPNSILASSKVSLFDVSSNNLSGSMPDFSKMTGLTYLSVSDNNWSAGAVPNLSSLTKLKVLSMWNSNRTGDIPASLTSLSKLQVLDLYGNSLTGDISTLAVLPDLQLISLGSNILSGFLPEITGFNSAEVIDLSGNQFRGKVPAVYGTLRDSGTNVFFESNYLTGTVLSSLDNEAPSDTNIGGNFCDGENTPQFRLTATEDVAVIKSTGTNIYSLLQNTAVSGTGTLALLPCENYRFKIVGDSFGKISVKTTSAGITVTAKSEVAEGENIYIEIWIDGNEGSAYSTVQLRLATFVQAKTHNTYIAGMPDGTFEPEGDVTREQIATMLARVLEIDTPKPNQKPFSDVEVDRWSAGFVEAARKGGYIKGYTDGTFEPAQPMTRAELATILVRDARNRSIQISGQAIHFKDVPVDSWYYEYVIEASARGLVNGVGDSTFAPDRYVTREEAVVMINRAFGRNPKTSEDLQNKNSPFKDVLSSRWSYWDILEAAVAHKH
jgi:Leucine-rich repeat (LRR) protein